MVPAFPNFNAPTIDDGKLFTSSWRAFFQWVWTLRNVTQVAFGASGTTLADATPIEGDWVEVTSASAGTGVAMTGLGEGDTVVVMNASGVSINVYPIPKARIDALAIEAPYVLASSKMQIFRQFSAVQVYSEQLG